MDDLLSEFLDETAKNLAVLDVERVKFEQDPNDPEILGNIFRLMHTIKGTSGFLGLARLEGVALVGEDVIRKFRDGALQVTPDAATLILRCIDTVRELLGKLEESGSEPRGDDSAMIAELRTVADGKMPSRRTRVEAAGESAVAAAREAQSSAHVEPAASVDGFPVARELLDELAAAWDPDLTTTSEGEIAASITAERASEGDTRAGPQPAPEPSPLVPVTGTALVERPESAPVESNGTADKAAKDASLATQSNRLDIALLENLMTLIGELVLTRNQLLHMVRDHDDSEFTVPLQRLSHITTKFHEGVMKARTQPIGNAWVKLPRIVHDLAVEMGKKIELVMLGADTEIDRQILERITDPLTHIVRNSADHGLEAPEHRAIAGKPETGTITLNAYHQDGHIIIDIGDDGRGLDMDRVREGIVANGLATDAELDAMGDQQVQQLIFKAGISTAENVTSVSGRGMDGVHANIEKIGGVMELKSVAGRGSTYTIKIPLTPAIVPALILECSGERFAIPQISVLKLVRASGNAENAIQRINDSPILRLRDLLLPLVSLHDLLKLGDNRKSERDEDIIVVTQAGNDTFGIIVDRVLDTEEIVVKPIPPILRHLSIYSGNTILGDGNVIMILDPKGVAPHAGKVAVGGAEATETAPRVSAAGEEKTSLLIFRAGGNELKAVPLGLVARLEEIDMANVERAHGNLVVQYRGRLMPLVHFDPAHAWKTEGRQPILVFTDRVRSMGLAVDEIVDTVENVLDVELSEDRPGLIGSAFIDRKATDVIDAGYYLTQVFPDWFAAENGQAPSVPLETKDSQQADLMRIWRYGQESEDPACAQG
jgi:two-component system chemotaxis sensor kinase CheA